jgi:hypothetical protein
MLAIVFLLQRQVGGHVPEQYGPVHASLREDYLNQVQRDFLSRANE